MIPFFVAAYVVPLLVEVPWLLSSTFLFFVTLHGLSRVAYFREAALRRMPRPLANRLRARTPAQERRYYMWCLAGAGVLALSLLFRALLYWIPIFQRFGNSAVGAVLLALFYSPIYHNGAELTGEWAWPSLRRSRLWRPFRDYFNFTPLYLHNPPGDLSARDEIRQTLKHKGLRRSKIETVMHKIDIHALLSVHHEPERFFTFSRAEYADQIGDRVSRDTDAESDAPPRRPRIYAVHPHGLSAITGVFGAAMYGEEPMLPDPDNVRLAVADALFNLPIIREWALAVGCISAGAEAISLSLLRGRDIFLFPGGMYEQAHASHQSVDIVWNRFGFCRIAYEHRASIVPICALGESSTYLVFNVLPSFRLRNYLRWGYAFPWLFVGPMPANVTPVVGLPIDTAQPRRTDAERSRAQRYLERKRYPHPRPDRFAPKRTRDDSDGDTPLVDLARVAVTLGENDLVAARGRVDDYYGAGYERLENPSSLWPSAEERDGSNDWMVRRTAEHREGDGTVTLLDAELDNINLIESSYLAEIQRAFYAQYVDIRDCAYMAVINMLPDVEVEDWGPTLTELRARLNRNNQARAAI